MSQTGNLTGLKLLLHCYNDTDVNTAGGFGYTALIWSSYYGYGEQVKTLLNHDQIDVNKVCDEGRSALFCKGQKGTF